MGMVMLVRHGQASFGTDDYDVLSEAGWEQSRALGRWIAEHGTAPATVIHGGMRRHRETWEGIAEGAGLVPQEAEVDVDWAEFDHLGVLGRHAELTGVSVGHDADRKTFQAHFEVATAGWATARPDAGYPETYDDFLARSRRALDAAATRPGPTLVVTSGGVIGALAALLVAPLGAPVGEAWARFNTVAVNTSMTRVITNVTGARLLTFNEHAHLSRDEVTYR